MKRRMKLTATKVYDRFMGFIAGVQDKVVQDSIENLQKSLEYCMEENRVLKELLEEATGRKRNETLHCEVLSGIKGENLGRKT